MVRNYSFMRALTFAHRHTFTNKSCWQNSEWVNYNSADLVMWLPQKYSEPLGSVFILLTAMSSETREIKRRKHYVAEKISTEKFRVGVILLLAVPLPPCHFLSLIL